MYNLLVVDDESIIRNGMLDIIAQFDCFQSMSARNGMEALELIQSRRIDGMILDIKMPKMNGLELLKELKRNNVRIPTVILTGHEEFEYAQEALKYGAIDYVLKPVTPDDIKEFCRRIKDLLDAEKRKEDEWAALKRHVEESKPILKERLFHDILKGKVNEAEFIQKANFLGLSYLGNVFRVALLELEDFSRPNSTEEERQIVVRSVETLLEEYVRQTPGITLFHIDTNVFVVMFSFKEYRKEDNELIYDSLEIIKDTILTKTGLIVTVGIGEICLGAQNIKHSYYQAQTALRYKISMGKGQIYNIRDFEDHFRDIDIKVDTDEIITLLKTGQAERIRNEIKQRFDLLKSLEEKPDIYNVYILCSKYLTAFLSALKEYGLNLERLYGDKTTPFTEFLEKKSIGDLETWLLDLLEKVDDLATEYRTNKESSLVCSIKQFVQENYSQNITNRVLADRLGYSPNYLGQVFKAETGMTINEYINKTRIKKAKELIKQTHLMVYEIADRVGFNDHHYFSSVFKRFVGVSPREYRDL